MSAIASQITSLTIVYSTVYSGGEFPAQMSSNAENVSIWWRHHAIENMVLHLTDSLFLEVSKGGC